MVRRERLRKRIERRVAVRVLHVAEHLIVRAVLVRDEDDVMDLAVQKRHRGIDDRTVAESVVRIDLGGERRERVRSGNGQVQQPRLLLRPAVLVLVGRVARFARGRAVSVRRVGARNALLVHHIERAPVARDGDARGIPARRDAPEHAPRREVHDGERVLAAERHVQARAVGRDRAAVRVRTRVPVARTRERNRRDDRIARRVDDGDRVVVAVHHVERRAVGRERERVRRVADAHVGDPAVRPNAEHVAVAHARHVRFERTPAHVGTHGDAEGILAARRRTARREKRDVRDAVRRRIDDRERVVFGIRRVQRVPVAGGGHAGHHGARR